MMSLDDRLRRRLSAVEQVPVDAESALGRVLRKRQRRRFFTVGGGLAVATAVVLALALVPSTLRDQFTSLVSGGNDQASVRRVRPVEDCPGVFAEKLERGPGQRIDRTQDRNARRREEMGVIRPTPAIEPDGAPPSTPRKQGEARYTPAPTPRTAPVSSTMNLHRDPEIVCWAESVGTFIGTTDGYGAIASGPRPFEVRIRDREAQVRFVPADPGDGVRKEGPLHIVAEGEAEGGHRWALVVYESTAGLCVELRDADYLAQGGGGCGLGAPDAYAISGGSGSPPWSEGSQRPFLVGSVIEEVASLRAELTNGETMPVSVVGQSLDFGANFYVLREPDDASVEALVGLNADGDELFRWAWPRGAAPPPTIPPDLRSTPEPESG